MNGADWMEMSNLKVFCKKSEKISEECQEKAEKSHRNVNAPYKVLEGVMDKK